MISGIGSQSEHEEREREAIVVNIDNNANCFPRALAVTQLKRYRRVSPLRRHPYTLYRRHITGTYSIAEGLEVNFASAIFIFPPSLSPFLPVA